MLEENFCELELGKDLSAMSPKAKYRGGKEIFFGFINTKSFTLHFLGQVIKVNLRLASIEGHATKYSIFTSKLLSKTNSEKLSQPRNRSLKKHEN